MEEEGTEEIVNIFRGFAKYFKKAADVLEADNLKQHGIQTQEEQPKPLRKDTPTAPDWM